MKISVSHGTASCGTKAVQKFYQNWHLHDALYCFNRLMTAACADKLLLNTVPANHLFFVSELKRLAEGASMALMEELGRRCIEEYLQITDVKNGAGKTGRRKKIFTQSYAIPDDMGERIEDITPPKFSDPQLWMNAPLGGTQWQNFPRHLTARQFEDPWLALEAFVDHASAAQRDDQLDILLEQALSKTGIDDLITSSELIRMQQAWWQLLEGCHLLVVRKFNH